MNIEELKDQITSYETGLEALKQELKKLKEIENRIHYSPKSGERYWRIEWGNAEPMISEEDSVDDAMSDLGAAFRTKEEIEAQMALRRHVVEMNRKHGRYEFAYYLVSTGAWISGENVSVFDKWHRNLCYQDPRYISISSTKKERSLRLNLIEKAYGAS